MRKGTGFDHEKALGRRHNDPVLWREGMPKVEAKISGYGFSGTDTVGEAVICNVSEPTKIVHLGRLVAKLENGLLIIPESGKTVTIEITVTH